MIHLFNPGFPGTWSTLRRTAAGIPALLLYLVSSRIHTHLTTVTATSSSEKYAEDLRWLKAARKGSYLSSVVCPVVAVFVHRSSKYGSALLTLLQLM